MLAYFRVSHPSSRINRAAEALPVHCYRDHTAAAHAWLVKLGLKRPTMTKVWDAKYARAGILRESAEARQTSSMRVTTLEMAI